MKYFKLLSVVVLVLVFTVPVFALETAINNAIESCKKELKTYCKDVKPGDGRILACMYAHSDKISSRCEYALYDASVQLERAVSAITYVATECKTDLKSICSAVAPGKGRLATCLLENKKKLSTRCSQAVDDVNLQVE
jgi:hypothetical protein